MDKPTSDNHSDAKARPGRARVDEAPIRTWEQGVFLSAPFLLDEAGLIEAVQESRWKHYIYGLCLDNRAVFYVGKGTKLRALEHAKMAANGDDSEKARYIRHIGPRLRYTLFAFCEDEPYALANEASLIRRHHDVLTNVMVPSYEYIAKLFARTPETDWLTQSLLKLLEIGQTIQKGEAESRRSMIRIIEGCPTVIRTMTDEELEWTFELDDGARIRDLIEQKILELEHGCQ